MAERRRRFGTIALAAGFAWLLLTTQWIVPAFSGREHAAIGRYAYLGDSLAEITLNLFRHYDLTFQRLLSLESLKYLALLFLPLLWGLSRRCLPALIPILPQLLLNLLSDADAQRSLVHQYSVPILPFLILAVIATLTGGGGGWLRSPRSILVWAAVGFLTLAKPGYFWSRYLMELDTLAASREAVAQVTTDGGVFATSKIAPHLAHRRLIKQTITGMSVEDVTQFDYVILNRRHPGDGADRDFIDSLLARLEGSADFRKTYQRGEVFVFVRSGGK